MTGSKSLVSAPNTLTILRSRGPLLAKTWLPDGTIGAYDLAHQFHVREHPVAGLIDLHWLLQNISTDSRVAVIRGRLKPHLIDRLGKTAPASTVVRKLETFNDAPSAYFCIDVDGYKPETVDVLLEPAEAVAEYVSRRLPTCFHGAGYVYQLSGSMGHPSKPGVLRCHLYWLLAEPLTCAQAEAWARRYLPEADHTVHRPVQLNYTAAPVMMGDNTDPLVGQRIGLVRGTLQDELELPASMPVPQDDELRTERRGRRAMVDPREKPGVVGALCRAVSVSELPDLFPEVWQQGSAPRRITWLQGGGAPEGCVITDDELHLYNSHHTAPTDVASNVFDAIRTHVYGHLDDGLDPDALKLAPAQAPSYEATAAWALQQAGVPEELGLVGDSDGQQTAAAAEAARVEARALARTNLLLSTSENRSARKDRVLLQIRKADADELELGLCKQIAAMDWTDIERSEVVQAVHARTKLLSPPKGIELKTIRKWLEPREATATWPDVGDNGAPLLTIENLAVLFRRKGWTPRYNVITKAPELLGVVDTMIDNRANVVLSSVVSACGKHRIPQAVSIVKGYLAALCDANPFNPVDTWVQSAPWDGLDRFGDLLGTLKLAEGADPDLAATMLRKWLIQTVAAALSPVPLQARGTLVFCGPQYIGKSRWIQRLVGDASGEMGDRRELVRTGKLVDPHSKDSLLGAVRAWICELGELGQTMRKTDRDALKAFLAQDTDIVRLPYAAEESSYQRRTSFAASANDPQFLSDPTGNSRWWVLEVEEVNSNHEVDMQQVWAQAAALWRAGETHYFDFTQMQRVSLASEEYQVTDAVHESIAQALMWPQVRPSEEELDAVLRAMTGRVGVTPMTPLPLSFQGWEQMTCTQVLRLAGYRQPTAQELERAAHALPKLGGVKLPRNRSGRPYLVPPPRTGFEGLD